jgi:hypothetical protein
MNVLGMSCGTLVRVGLRGIKFGLMFCRVNVWETDELTMSSPFSGAQSTLFEESLFKTTCQFHGRELDAAPKLHGVIMTHMLAGYGGIRLIPQPWTPSINQTVKIVKTVACKPHVLCNTGPGEVSHSSAWDASKNNEANISDLTGYHL